MESSAHVAVATAPPGGHSRGGQATASQGLSSASREARWRPEISRALSQPRGSAGQKPVRPRETGPHVRTTGPGVSPHYNPQSPARRCPRKAVTHEAVRERGSTVAGVDDVSAGGRQVTRGQGL